MAEAAVSFVIEKLGDMLIHKIVFLKAVRGQVVQLRDELDAMRCFLKDAAEKQDEDDGIRNWVSQIRAAAYDSEDVIEIYIRQIQSQKTSENFFKKTVHKFGEVFTLNKLGKEIESIQQRIRDIADRRERLGIKDLGEGSTRRAKELQRLRRSSPLTEDKDVVGLEEKTSFLVSQLLNEEKCRSVVSIIGMGGVGKTTLARKVYQHPDVTARFSYRAWVCISQKYDSKDILGGIIKQVKTLSRDLLDMLEKMQEPDLEQMLSQELKDKCYLIVVDDIWKKDDWDCLLRAFPDGDKSSRVLLTSRNQDVPLHSDPQSFRYAPKPLGLEDSWQLLLKKAFGDHINSRSLVEFEDVGREITRRCAGLPLAITVIGGLLAGKKTLDQWKRVLNSIIASNGQTEVSEILAFSYNDLPSHLKYCFLYFGFFPEDFEVRTKKLFQLWIAEGLIQQKGRESLEDVAADFLDELVSRNMVQVTSWSSDETVKSCRTHDLMRDLAIKKAREEIFLEIDGVGDAQLSSKARHLAVHCHSKRYMFTNSIPHIRSLLLFSISCSAKVSLDVTCFKLLRVLDLENLDIEYLPEEIGEVGLLRFLCLRRTKIKKLPSSLGRLRNLQTLDIFNFGNGMEVPDVIWKLENLRNLYMHDIECNMPLKVDTLRNLQTLSLIKFGSLMHNNLSMMTSLQELGVWINEEWSEIDKLLNFIAELPNLRSLSLFMDTKKYHSLDGVSKLCHLTKLKVRGRLERLPDLHDFPPSLSYLSLKSTQLDEDPMLILGMLEQLSVLKLNDAYRGRQIAVQENSFPRLKHFTLSGCPHLEDIALGKGAMPELRCLRISHCNSLEMLPEELKRMTSLQRLEITEMKNGFVARIRGVDWYKVCHVPSLILNDNLDEKIKISFSAYVAALKFLDGIKSRLQT